MTRKIDKVLAKLSEKECNIVEGCVKKLISGKTTGLNIKKLKGYTNIFRAKKGSMRILYRVEKQGIFILAIERRKENTYKNI